MYKKINFAEVVDINDFDNPEALEKRKAYIEDQMNKGFFEKLATYQKDNKYCYWKDLVSWNQKLIEQARGVYKKNQQNGAIVFQLEQVLGRAEYLFDKRENATLATNSQDYLDYQDNLQQLELLSKQLSGHKSIMVRNLGISLIAVAALMAVSSFLVSLFVFGGIFIAGIAVIGVVITGSGTFALYKQQQKGLSLTTSVLITTANEVKSTLDYFDNVVSPKLDKEDSSELRNRLVLQLNKGFDAVVLKNALQWVSGTDYISKGWYDKFFDYLADICCDSSDYWVNYIRKPKEYWICPPEEAFSQLWHPKPPQNSFFACFTKSAHTAKSTLKLFDEISTGTIDSKDQMTFREGLQHLMNAGIKPSLLKHALVWAKARYDFEAIQTGSFGNYGRFFERLAVICGVVLAPKVLAVSLPKPNALKPQGLETVPIRELSLLEFS